MDFLTQEAQPQAQAGPAAVVPSTLEVLWGSVVSSLPPSTL